MSDPPPIPKPLWQTVPPDAQEAVRARFEGPERRIAESEQRLKTNSTNSSKPRSSDPPVGQAAAFGGTLGEKSK